MNELINDIKKCIYKTGFETINIELDNPCYLGWEHQTLFINTELATPFTLFHEYCHIVLKHKKRLSWSDSDIRNAHEHEANVLAVEYLLKYHVSTGAPYNYTTFMDWYGVPAYLENMVIDVMGDVAMYG